MKIQILSQLLSFCVLPIILASQNSSETSASIKDKAVLKNDEKKKEELSKEEPKESDTKEPQEKEATKKEEKNDSTPETHEGISFEVLFVVIPKKKE